jgi:hypothetical protein
MGTGVHLKITERLIALSAIITMISPLSSAMAAKKRTTLCYPLDKIYISPYVKGKANYKMVKKNSKFRNEYNRQALSKLGCYRPGVPDKNNYIPCYLNNPHYKINKKRFELFYISCRDQNDRVIPWTRYDNYDDETYGFACGKQFADECDNNVDITL